MTEENKPAEGQVASVDPFKAAGDLMMELVSLAPEAQQILLATFPNSQVTQLVVKYSPILLPILQKWGPILQNL